MNFEKRKKEDKGSDTTEQLSTINNKSSYQQEIIANDSSDYKILESPTKASINLVSTLISK